ncbi:MAG: hypothetical protein EAZ66_06690 [Alphaproteobacteria bacterium]|nr:MAG: hypothetical protein EAZ66_06690 [Alphaproteobacteria bacterium]
MKVGDNFIVENKFKKQFKEVYRLSYGDEASAFLSNTWRSGSLQIAIQNEEEVELLEGFMGDDYFCSEGFSNVELLSTDDLIDESWEFESNDDFEKFQEMYEESDENCDDFQEYLENCHGFVVEAVYFEVEDGGTNIRNV